MKTKIIVTALCVGLFGCTSARISSQLSAGLIGCPSKMIRITDETASVSGMHEWTAYCQGKTYQCSYVYGSTATCTERKDIPVIDEAPSSIPNMGRDECLSRSRYNEKLICPPE